MEITLGQQYNIREKPTVILYRYTYINHHAQPPIITQHDHCKQYFGGIKNEVFLKNEFFFKDPEGVNLRSARPFASCSYWLV